MLPKVGLSIALCLCADFGVGLMCVCKPDASCGECCKQKMKCDYPGKTSIRVGSLTKGQPIIMVPTPKHESLEVRHQEVVVWEWANELAEAHLEVDCNMVCTMSRVNMVLCQLQG